MANPIYVEYTGTKVGGFTVYGEETRRPYRVSVYQPIFLADERDVPGIVARRDFRPLSDMNQDVPANFGSGVVDAERAITNLTGTEMLRKPGEQGQVERLKAPRRQVAAQRADASRTSVPTQPNV